MDEKDRIKEGANTAQSYIHIDTDTEYTERVTWTNYSSPVTMHQLNDALSNAVVGFTKTEPAQTIQGTFYPARTHDVRIESRRNITVAGQAGLEITANDDYSKNGFFRVFPVGHRLYLLSVVSDATEDPDVATNNHKIEVERFFNSLKQVPAPQGKLSNK